MFDTQTVETRALQSDYAKENTRVGRAVYSPVQHFRSGDVAPVAGVSVASRPPAQVASTGQANAFQRRVLSNKKRPNNKIYTPSIKEQAAPVNAGETVRNVVYDLRLKKCAEEKQADPVSAGKSLSIYEWLTNA